MKKSTIITIIILVFICALAAGVIFTKVKTVNVEGNAWYTDGQVQELIFPDELSSNSAWAFFNNIFGTRRTIPFIEDYKMSFKSPTEVDIIVYEKSIVGYVSYMDNYMYFDKDGIIVDSSLEKLNGIPEITGLEFGSIVLYRELPVGDAKVFNDILNLTQLLTTYEISSDKIEYSGLREATLYLGGIEVQLGSNDDMNGKISELKDILPSLEGRQGILYLDSYDPEESSPVFVFKPKS